MKNLAEQLAPSNIGELLGETPHNCELCGKAITNDEDQEQYQINNNCFACEDLREQHQAGLDGQQEYEDEEV